MFHVLGNSSLIGMGGSHRSSNVEVDAVYDTYINLNEYHRYVLAKLEEEEEVYQNKVKELMSVLEEREEKQQTVVEKINLELEIKTAKDSLQKRREDKKTYLRRINPILKEYRQRCKEAKISIDGVDNNHILKEVIDNFFRVARLYLIDLNVREEVPDGVCYKCKSKLDISEDRTLAICSGCDLVMEIADIDMYKKNELPMPKNGYESTDNFIKALDAYQGIVKSVPPKSLIENLRSYMHKYNISETSLSVNDLRDILKSMKKSSYYNAVHHLHNILTGKPLADLSSIRDQVIEDCRIFDTEFSKIKEKGRYSSMNTQKKLYILLRKNGHNCSPDDFKIPKTPDIDIAYNAYITRIFKSLGWDTSIL